MAVIRSAIEAIAVVAWFNSTVARVSCASV